MNSNLEFREPGNLTDRVSLPKIKIQKSTGYGTRFEVTRGSDGSIWGILESASVQEMSPRSKYTVASTNGTSAIKMRYSHM